MFRRGALLMMSLALFAAACSSGDGRDGAVKELTDQGFSEQAAECLITEIDASDLSISEITGETVTPKAQKVMEAAMRKCASAEDVGNLLQDVSLEDEAIRDQFVSSMVVGAGGTIDRPQAECITDYLIEQDVTLSDLSQAAVGGQLPPDMQELINAAVEVCVQP